MTLPDKTGQGAPFAAEVLREHKDLIPEPYGEPDALEQSGSVATPLMAGFALTMASLVLTSAASFRWPNLVLLLLTFAVVSLVMSIQAAQWARTFRVRPEEVEAWWPGMTPLQRPGRVTEILAHHKARALWTKRQRLSYRLGILALLAGLAVALVPPVPKLNEPSIGAVRWVAVSVAALGFGLELAWIAAGHFAYAQSPRRARARAKQWSKHVLGIP